jgi:raffinose/stachyose/melibiose transport system permease protein
MTGIPKRILPTQTENAIIASRRRRQFNKALLVFMLLAPGMIFFFMFLLLPVSNSIRYSLYDWNGFGPPTDYVRFDNYDRLLNHDVFRMSIEHTLIIVGLSLAVQLPLALSLALVVGRGRLPGRAFFRTMLFIPFVFSEILTSYMWLYVFEPRSGLINTIIQSVAPDSNLIVWLADPKLPELALFSIFLVITWKYFGLHMILYMAALQNVPRDLEEAARIDGAGEMSVLRYITIPMIGPAIRLTVYLSVLGSFQQFVLIWIMTKGGPSNATQVIATYLYKFGIINVKLGYGSAIAVILFIITFTFSLLYQFFVMRRDYEYETE